MLGFVPSLSPDLIPLVLPSPFDAAVKNRSGYPAGIRTDRACALRKASAPPLKARPPRGDGARAAAREEVPGARGGAGARARAVAAASAQVR